MEDDARRLSPTEAAKVLGVSRQHVYNLIDLGVLPAHKVPRWTGTLVTRLWERDVLELRKDRDHEYGPPKPKT